ncbi:MAG: hypothetical protein QOG85_2660 [Gaiellaceae bacterium]|jgi:hypothetical protein|nr:hypothetical protein [Gaiellaceae bacterium]
MSPEALQDRSERLAALVDGLGAALRGTGISEDAAMRLLENASAAVLDALTLDFMLADSRSVPATPVVVEQPAAAPALPLAA